MLEDQKGGCYICGELETEFNTLHVDHDHLTGKILSLLCVNCNSGIGRFKENPELMLKAITYLEKHNKDYNE